MCMATNGSETQVEGWQAIALLDSLREAATALQGAVYEMQKIATGERAEPGELIQYYRDKAERAKAQLARLEPGEGAPPASDKDWYCNECGNANVVHEAEVQWNRQYGCMEVVNLLGDRHCVECMQEQSYPENPGEPVFGVLPAGTSSAA